jgi:hypothetical protein
MPWPKISEQIWDMKYRLKAADGSALDHTIADTWARVAQAAATAEPKRARERWARRFADAMADFAFLPAGRILAGAGTGRAVTLFNCFVMGRIEDDLGSIFDNVKEAARTMQQGGGIGHDFSTLRPKGALVRSIGADASGPVSFMDVWDAMCRTIMSAGARRGAMMATLRCDHPDIEAFIDAKADSARLAQLQPVSAGDGRIHSCRAQRRAVGPHLRRQGLPHGAGARAVGAHDARHLRVRGARRRLHRPHSTPTTTSPIARRSAPPIPAFRATPGCTRATARGRSAALWGIDFSQECMGRTMPVGSTGSSGRAASGS